MEFIFSALTWMALTSWFFYLSVIAIFGGAYIFVRGDGKDDGFPFFPSLFVGTAIYLSTIRFDSTDVLIQWPNILYTIGGYLIIGFFVSLFKWIRKLSDFKTFASNTKALMGLKKFKDEAEKNAYDVEWEFKNKLENEYGHSSIGDIEGKCYLKPKASTLTRHWIYWPFFLLSVLIDPIYDIVNFLVTVLKGFYTNLSKKFAV